MPQYVVILNIDAAELNGDESVENACRHANVALDLGTEGTVPTNIQPLSETIAC